LSIVLTFKSGVLNYINFSCPNPNVLPMISVYPPSRQVKEVKEFFTYRGTARGLGHKPGFHRKTFLVFRLYILCRMSILAVQGHMPLIKKSLGNKKFGTELKIFLESKIWFGNCTLHTRRNCQFCHCHLNLTIPPGCSSFVFHRLCLMHQLKLLVVCSPYFVSCTQGMVISG